MNDKNQVLKKTIKSMENTGINIAKSFSKKIILEDGFQLFIGLNPEDEAIILTEWVSKDFVQFHFCLSGAMELLYHGGAYKRPLQEETSLVLYNPVMDLPVELSLKPKSTMVLFLISIEKLHSFFSSEAHFIDFLNTDNRDKKYYRELPISPNIITVLNQLIHFEPHANVAKLYFKAKALELISLYFNHPQDLDLEQCPFLVDEKNVAKIRMAKEVIIKKMVEPPTLQELADEVQLPLNSLKKGFKQVYGDTVFGFLVDYKMEQARQLLLEGSLNVNEVGLKVGYSASSHFITAFKQKFGITPKKFLMDNGKSLI